ncbi:MAG: DKNYY domain-containing protein, partial [Gallionella sp.]
KDADSQSFRALDDKQNNFVASDYALDKHYLYCNGKIVEGATADNLREIHINNNTYLLNDTQVIYDGRVMRGANPGNFGGFEGVSSWTYSVNAGQYLVFSQGFPLPAVDRGTFTPLNNSIAKDKQHIFKGQDQILPGADVATFELLNDNDFGKDKYHVYYLATKLPFAINDADPDSFKILQRGYVKDKNHVYVVHLYESVEKLEKADAASFEATQYDDITKSEARDARHYYYGDKVVGDR